MGLFKRKSPERKLRVFYVYRYEESKPKIFMGHELQHSLVGIHFVVYEGEEERTVAYVDARSVAYWCEASYPCMSALRIEESQETT